MVVRSVSGMKSRDDGEDKGDERDGWVLVVVIDDDDDGGGGGGWWCGDGDCGDGGNEGRWFLGRLLSRAAHDNVRGSPAPRIKKGKKKKKNININIHEYGISTVSSLNRPPPRRRIVCIQDYILCIASTPCLPPGCTSRDPHLGHDNYCIRDIFLGFSFALSVSSRIHGFTPLVFTL